MPSRIPRTVASTMPVTARRRVLSKPSTRASLTGWVWRKSLPAIGKLAGWSRKSKPVGMFPPVAVDLEVVVEPGDHGDDGGEHRQLERPREDADVAVERRPPRRRRGDAGGRRRTAWWRSWLSRLSHDRHHDTGQCSAVGRGVLQTAVDPQGVDAALDAERGEVRLEDLAVVADLVDDIEGEMPGRARGRGRAPCRLRSRRRGTGGCSGPRCSPAGRRRCRR